MPTSAQDRFNTIFSGKAQPPKPQPGQKTLFEIERDKLQHLQTAKSVTAGDTQDDPTRHMKTNTASGVVPVSSDEDDDYVAAVSKAPKLQASHTAAVKSSTHGLDRSMKSSRPFAERVSDDQSMSSLRASTKDETTLEHSGPLKDDVEEGPVACFCIFGLVAKFPYKYMNDTDNRVSDRFFARDQFYLREWNIYYLHLPESFGAAPLMLVSYAQVERLVQGIAKTFDLSVSVPKDPFTLNFYDDATPQPVFLGVSHNRAEFTNMQYAIPEPLPGHGESSATASPETARAFKRWYEKCERALAAGKKSKGAKRKNKSEKDSAMVQQHTEQLKRAERYFGLRPRPNPIARPQETLTWEGEQAQNARQQEKLFISFLDVTQAAPYSFDNQPIIISVDVESYERDHSLITELGISTLDTLDLVDVPPGPAGVDWIKQIRSRHVLINGREHLVNRDFVAGCPQSFQFGTSERCYLEDAAETLDSCFEWPFSVQYKHDSTFQSQSQIEGQGSHHGRAHEDLSQLQKGPKRRNILLLGHDVGTDLSYLGKLGSHIFGPSHRSGSTTASESQRDRHHVLAVILEALDTATMYKVLQRDKQTRSLASICNDLGIDAWCLHNAGNDARYTLECLVKIVIKARIGEDDAMKAANPSSTCYVEDEWEVEKQRRVDEKMERSRQANEEKYAK